MSKWLRDRMRRRRKEKTPIPGAADNPPPLQPIFLEPDAQSLPPAAPMEAPAPAELPVEASATPGSPRTPGRKRRRRGRRGRGGRAAAPAASSAPLRPAYPETAEQTGPAMSTVEPPAVAPARAQRALAPPTQPRLSKGTVILAIGLPGSGKSTWFRRRGVTPLSSDVIRSMLFDDITEQRFQDLVFSTLRSLLRARLLARMAVNYVDATNLSPHDRRGWIKMAHDLGYEVQAVFFDVPLEVCQERNQRRNRVVPEDVMQRMAGKLRPPKFEEGFSKITVVRVKRSAEEQAPELSDGEGEAGS